MKHDAPLSQTDVWVSFGDCDPAGIVYYPNFLKWADSLFHQFLRERLGGHSAICTQIGAKGLGVIAVETSFRSPVFDGDLLSLSLERIDWSKRSFTLEVVGKVGERLAFSCRETRGIFVSADGGIKAGDTDMLKSKLT